jgi:DNA modification methylase
MLENFNCDVNKYIYFETENGILYNENCIDTMARMQDNYIDLTLTSPPYDNLRSYQGYQFDYKKVIKELYRITKIGGVVVWVVGDATVNGSETGTSFKQALYFKEIGFNLHDTMIWEKCSFNHDPRNKRYKQNFEYIFIFTKKQPKTYNEIKDIPIKNAGKIMKSSKRLSNGKIRDYGYIKMNDFQARSNVWQISQDTKNSHPAPFPEQLAQDHIISWSNENDLIYDCFSGSGTTFKMAEKLNRKFIGSEIAADYCEITKQRILSLNKYKFAGELL